MIQLENISKQYQTKRGTLSALNDLSFSIKPGEFVVVRGPSGSGKTTLLLTLGGMLRPSQGTIKIDDQDLYSMSVPKRAQFRAENIGFVFQMFHLINYLNVLENVLMAAGTVNKPNAQHNAEDILNQLGMGERLTHTPSELSAGEKQRTAIARALLNQPKLILADEPTGNLDPDNAKEVMDHLSKFHQSGGTVVVVTHGTVADHHANRIIHLANGQCNDV